MNVEEFKEECNQARAKINNFNQERSSFLNVIEEYNRLKNNLITKLEARLRKIDGEIRNLRKGKDSISNIEKIYNKSTQKKLLTYIDVLNDANKEKQVFLRNVINARPDQLHLGYSPLKDKMNRGKTLNDNVKHLIDNEIKYWKDILELIQKIPESENIKALINDFKDKKPKILTKTTFAQKVVTNDKTNIEKYIDKIDNQEESLKESNSTAIIPEKLAKSIVKIKNRFIRITDFCKNYRTQLNGILDLGLNEENLEAKKLDIKQYRAKMKKLTKQEITDSLKDSQEAFDKFFYEAEKHIAVLAEDTEDGKKIKTTHLTIPNSAFDAGKYELNTPFGKVDVIVKSFQISGSSDKATDIMIEIGISNTYPTYDEIIEKLDPCFSDISEDNKNSKIEGIIDPMINYLKQRTVFNNTSTKNQDLLFKIKAANSNFLNSNDDAKKMAAVLCGILMLSESHQFRNPTLNKFETNALKTVKVLANKLYTKPFGKVFSNKTGRYVPAHSAESDGGKKSEKKVNGGMKQARMLLTYKLIGPKKDIAITVSELPRDLFNEINTEISSKLCDENGNIKPREKYIKVKDLPDRPYNFGSVTKSIKKFIKDQVNRNAKKMYKSQNHTGTSGML